ncbi:MAG TPA: hypothetical protein VMU34_04655 [Mycobacterium sp.]|nr:hypothetical protein [Mycobacterium sp.]
MTEFPAVTCQFIQQTDPRFPLVYFTIWSALLAGLTAAATLWRPNWAWLVPARVATTVGVLVSAVIFAAVIAPATPTGTWFQPWDDGLVRAANVLAHGVAPVFVVVDLCTRRPWRRLSGWLAAAYAWPLTYLAASSALVMFGVGPVYPFLSPSQCGWSTVLMTIAALIVLVGVLTAILRALSVVVCRQRNPAQP